MSEGDLDDVGVQDDDSKEVTVDDDDDDNVDDIVLIDVDENSRFSGGR
jgi:hypothetical protein